MARLSSKICPACGNSSASFFAVQKSYIISRCKSCEFLFAEPSSEAKLATYDETYFTDFVDRDKAGKLDNSYRTILKHAEAHAPGRHLLDVGCGAGGFLAFARSRGWLVEGIDGAPAAVKFVATQLGIRATHSNLDDCELPECAYDFINSMHVIEHLLRPRHFISRINIALKPKGIVVLGAPIYDLKGIRLHNGLHKLKVANFPYDYMLPDHVSYFSPNSLRTLLAAENFCVLDVWFTARRNLMQIINDFGDSSRLRRGVKTAAQLASPVLERIGYFRHMNIVAKKVT